MRVLLYAGGGINIGIIGRGMNTASTSTVGYPIKEPSAQASVAALITVPMLSKTG